jgi:hypothetical protein
MKLGCNHGRGLRGPAFGLTGYAVRYTVVKERFVFLTMIIVSKTIQKVKKKISKIFYAFRKSAESMESEWKNFRDFFSVVFGWDGFALLYFSECYAVKGICGIVLPTRDCRGLE